MKILVTGSSGHLGEAICRVLKKRAIDYIGIDIKEGAFTNKIGSCLLYTSPSPRDQRGSRMPSSA